MSGDKQDKILKKIDFYKMVGTGNDFVMIDNMKNDYELNEKLKDNSFVKNLCDRMNGIGSDGIILIEPKKTETSDFSMRIINSDGTEAEMCGNGARCITYFAYSVGVVKKTFMKFDTLAGEICGGIIVDNDDKKLVKVKMINPHSLDFDKELDLPEIGKKKIYSINTGVPHAIVFVENGELEKVNVNKIGSFIRYNDVFAPKGTNVNFVEIAENTKHDIFVRTYERGVESETLSCGSGSTASAIISSLQKSLYTPISVHTKGKDILKIYFEKEFDENEKLTIKNVFLEGEVKIVYKGSFEI
jgi:diaminopimelate epimerase